MYLIGVAAFVFSIILVPMTLKGVSLYNLSNPAAIIPQVLVVISVLLATSGFKLFVRGLNAAISRKYHLPREERRNAAALFRLLSKVSIGTGLLVMFFGIVAALGHMEDAEALGHAIAAVIVAPMCGAFVPVALFEPIVFILKHRGETVAKTAVKAYPKALGDKLLELCYQNGLTAEDIERATGIELHGSGAEGGAETADAAPRSDGFPERSV